MILKIEDEMDLAKIAQSGQCFRWEALPGGAWRVVQRGECLTIAPQGGGVFTLDCPEADFAAVWRDYFDLTENYASIRSRIDPARDPFLWRAAEAERGIRILRQEPWEALVSFIISQNKNIPAIRRAVAALCGIAGETRTDAGGTPYRTFPAAEAVAALTEDELRACGLGYRARYVHAAAEAVCSGALDLPSLSRAEDEEVIERLCALCGVGVKVARCVALYGLHRTDAFPIDVWVRRILDEQYPAGYPMEEYRPYNGVYQQYMFAYYRNRQ